ncbi:FkbM family methyltransferase [Streptomyces sp. SID13031]|uniref:FkbM family methyltransferase n=1 Tax=Streptomyces sp. SID13031 TaxID=2706046 RepID=UPI0013C589EB|nr:FkbM family methyltransferase [Streptomyces sp. SID13031]NEA35347.1 FkbM family methyltransferase [Streptomyces sp. SID13031]
MEYRDGAVRRAAWEIPRAVGRSISVDAARRLARVVGSAEGLTEAGTKRVAHRISPRLADQNPRLVKISPEWATTDIAVRRQGLHWRLDLRDNLQAVLYYAGRYEPAVTRFLRAELKPGDVVLDIGANIGLHSLGAARQLRELGGGRVIAFEPAADSLDKLRAAAECNNLADLITLVPAALGERKHQAALHADTRYDPADSGVRSLNADGEVVQDVPVIRLDDWAREQSLDRVDIVKLDVEGSEAAALGGATRTLVRLQPRAVLVEDKRPDLRRQLHAVLDELGYRSTGVTFDHNTLFRPDRRESEVTRRHSLR